MSLKDTERIAAHSLLTWEDQQRLYAEEKGREALQRQQRLKKELEAKQRHARRQKRRRESLDAG